MACKINRTSMIEDVTRFCFVMGHPIAPSPVIPDEKVVELRNKLNQEEYLELCTAVAEEDLVGIADGIADLIYVLIGQALAYGIPLQKVWDAVQTANMSKLWTEEQCKAVINDPTSSNWVARSVEFPYDSIRKEIITKLGGDPPPTWFRVRDEKGKIRKPPTWVEPDIKGIIQEANNLSPRTEDTNPRPEEA